MDASSLRALIEDVAAGRCTPDDAVRQLRRLPYSDLGFARVDHHRDLRLGMPEAVYGPGKTPEHCAAVVEELLAATDGPVLLDPGDRSPGEGGHRRRAPRSASGPVPWPRAGPWRRWCSARRPREAGRSSSSPPARPTSRWPPSARRCWARSASPPTQLDRLRRGGAAPAAGRGRHARHGRRRRGHRRHGGRAGQRGGRPHAGARGRRPHEHGLRRRLRGRDRAARHAVRLLLGHHRRRHRQRLRRRLRRSPGSSRDRPAGSGPGSVDGRLVPLLRRHRRRHGAGIAGRRGRRRRRGPCAARPPGPAGLAPRVRGRHPRRHRLHPRHRRAATTWWCAPTA